MIAAPGGSYMYKYIADHLCTNDKYIKMQHAPSGEGGQVDEKI